MKFILAILLFFHTSCATAHAKKELPQPMVSEDIIYEATIKCLSPAEAENAIIGAVDWDCTRYNMEGILYVETVQPYKCRKNETLFTFTFTYQCKAIKNDEHLESETAPQQ